jgi:alpha-beta hydrolase superfamily lysophospholipase
VVFSNEYDAGQAGWGELPEHLRRHGYTVLTYDWRGLGASGGRFDPTKAADDLRAAVAYLRQARPAQLVLVGASLGAMVTATQATALHPVAIGLLSPARSFAGITVSDQVMRRLGMPQAAGHLRPGQGCRGGQRDLPGRRAAQGGACLPG